MLQQNVLSLQKTGVFWTVLLVCQQNSARIIRTSVFGVDEQQKVRDSLRFPQDSLVVTSVDIQAVEPVDQRTRDSLQKSVQLAIEITTNSQEAAAKYASLRTLLVLCSANST